MALCFKRSTRSYDTATFNLETEDHLLVLTVRENSFNVLNVSFRNPSGLTIQTLDSRLPANAKQTNEVSGSIYLDYVESSVKMKLLTIPELEAEIHVSVVPNEDGAFFSIQAPKNVTIHREDVVRSEPQTV